MIERPIIFSTRWIQAILAGTKTETRRPHASEFKPSPFGVPGDRLYVRECHRYVDGWVVYRADRPDESGPWKSARLMPKRAARIVLTVRSVAITPLKSITDAQAWAEGVDSRADYLDAWDATYPDVPSAGDPLVWRCQFTVFLVRRAVKAIDPAIADDEFSDDELESRIKIERDRKLAKAQGGDV